MLVCDRHGAGVVTGPLEEFISGEQRLFGRGWIACEKFGLGDVGAPISSRDRQTELVE